MQRASSMGTLNVDQPSGTEINTSNNLRAMHADDHEYVQAMLEDLCDWFNRLYSLKLTADTFIAALDNGVLLCQLASLVQSHAKTYFDRMKNERQVTADAPDSGGEEHLSKLKIGHNLVKLPKAAPHFNANATSGTFFARDNISNFISWCKLFGVPPYFMFETNDIVLRRNVKNVLLCLLIIARIGSEFGIDVPDLIKLEQEIDSEEACLQNDQEQAMDTEEIERLNLEMLREQEIQHRMIVDDQEHKRMLLEQELAARQLHEKQLFEQQELLRLRQLERESLRRIKLKNQRLVDMRTLDEVIREMISDCACDMPISMKKIAPGKYQFGEEKTMIFVRILRNHVMVRVGGGWDTFECFLWKHDPCRRHRPREELQQRAADVLQRQREIFYCDESDQSAANQVMTKRLPMLSSASRTTSLNHSDNAVVPNLPATPRSRVRPSSAMGEPQFDVPDGAVRVNGHSTLTSVTDAGAMSGTTNKHSGIPLTRPQSALAAPRVRRKTEHTLMRLGENDQSCTHQPNLPVGATELNALAPNESVESITDSGALTSNVPVACRPDDSPKTNRAAAQKNARLTRAQTIEINNVGGVLSKSAPIHAVANPRVAQIRKQSIEHPAPRNANESRTNPLPENNVLPTDNAVALFQPIRPASPVSSMSPTPSTDSDTNNAQNAIQTNKSRASKLAKTAQAVPKSNLISQAPQRRPQTASSAPTGARSNEPVASGQNSSLTKQSPNNTVTGAPISSQSGNPRPAAQVVHQRATPSPAATAHLDSTAPRVQTTTVKKSQPASANSSKVAKKSVSSNSQRPVANKQTIRQTPDKIVHQKAPTAPEMHTKVNANGATPTKPQSKSINQGVSASVTSPSFNNSPYETTHNGHTADPINLSPSNSDSGMSSDMVASVRGSTPAHSVDKQDLQVSVGKTMEDRGNADVSLEKQKTTGQSGPVGSSYPNSKLPVSAVVHRSHIPLPHAHA